MQLALSLFLSSLSLSIYGQCNQQAHQTSVCRVCVRV